MKKCLNLGCGSRYRDDWINLDISPINSHVQAWDLRGGIPFPDNTFDIVYHSHLLEHIKKTEAIHFLQECYRVLKPGGVIRVVVPDLEVIVRLYLEFLDGALKGEIESQRHYDWIMLEMYDQAVRESSGGGMLDYFHQSPIPDEFFVRQRLGGEILRMVSSVFPTKRSGRPGIWVHPKKWLAMISNIYQGVRNGLYFIILGRLNYVALRIGRFRMSGEVHQWMYDRHSLAQALLQAGFNSPALQTPSNSLIPGWIELNLDTDPDGSVYKPDSLYMDAIK